MGIRGLLRLLEDNLFSSVEYIDPVKATLLVDGNGLAYHIFDRLLEGRQFCGSYDDIHDLIVLEIRKLRDQMKFDLLVFFDGRPIGDLKTKTAEERKKEVNECWGKLLDSLSNPNIEDQSCLPMFVLNIDQMVASLLSLEIPVVKCHAEADNIIAYQCKVLNAESASSGREFFVYAKDSDFVAMRDVPYIPFEALDFDEKDSVSNIKVSPVFRRNKVASYLDLTEDQFVELCIIIGNDYTHHFSRNLFEITMADGMTKKDAVVSIDAETIAVDSLNMDDVDVGDEESGVREGHETDCSDDDESNSIVTSRHQRVNLPNKWNLKALEALRTLIGSQPSGFKLTSRNAELQLAIDFSRDVYQLNSLLPYDQQAGDMNGFKAEGDEDENDDGEGYDYTSLSDEQSDFVMAALKSGELQIPTRCPPDRMLSCDIGDIAVSLIQRSLSGSAFGFDSVEVFPYLDKEHVEALRHMLQSLRGSSAAAVEPSSLLRPRWQDLLVSVKYQLVCRQVGRLVRKQIEATFTGDHNANDGSRDGFHIQTWNYEPRFLFDGKKFHQALANLRANSLSLGSSISGSVLGPSTPDPVTSVSEKMTKLSVKELFAQSRDTAAASGATAPLNPQGAADSCKVVSDGRETLPIDAFREEILRRIARDRVIIIHGETGCGKSSRLPAMLLEDAESRNVPFRAMISQPRRIAASSLMKRLRITLGNKVGMRMGHGVKDENDETKMFFVTTGYLVRLLAHHPESFKQHTHLIIDEVHERSVDGDLLCLLARRLLENHPTLRLILMSATIHTDLYREYFKKEFFSGDNMDCLSVGARRFPVEITYLDDMSAKGITAKYPPQIIYSAQEVSKFCGKVKSGIVPQDLPGKQYALAVSLIKSLGKIGSAILVFVSGIADITELTEKLEGLSNFKTIAIHSDIPFEEQEAAFLPAGPDEIKVVIATNAAESSITLPDVDLVLCLGTHKALQYHKDTHKVHLVNTWISKASATQRAGRTGRVRPGRVIRLYTREIHDTVFREHEESEIHRKPLQDVILGLRNMLEDAEDFEGVVPILEELLEPPDMDNVKNSFEFLYDADMITSPDDEGQLTSVGQVASRLPVDLKLGRLICYGINLGVGAEAVVAASALSQPKTLFRIASPLVHSDPDEIHEIICTTLLGALALDRGMYSEPMMYVNAFNQWIKLAQENQFSWCQKHGIALARMKQFASSTKHLFDRVNESLVPDTMSKRRGMSHRTGSSGGVRDPRTAESLCITDLDKSPLISSLAKQNFVRLVLAWSNDDSVLIMESSKKDSKGGPSAFYTVTIEAASVSARDLVPLFPVGVEWEYDASAKKVFDARFNYDDRTLLDILHSVLHESQSPVVWMIGMEEIPGRSDNNRRKRGGDNDDADNDASSVLVVAILTPVCDGKALEKGFVDLAVFRNMFFSEFSANGQLVTKITIDELIWDIFAVQMPSKRQLRWWKDMHDTIPQCISLRMPPKSTGQNAKIRDNNCNLTEAQLARIFFGVSVASTLELTADAATKKKSGYYISEQIIAVRQNIVFPNPLANLAASGDWSLFGGEEGAGGGGGGPGLPPLIRDIPLGMRLLHAYRQINRDKKLHIWERPRAFGPMKSYFRVSSSSSLSPPMPAVEEDKPGGGGGASANSPKALMPAKVMMKQKKTLTAAAASADAKKITDKTAAALTNSSSPAAAVVPGSKEYLKLKLQREASIANAGIDDDAEKNIKVVTLKSHSSTWQYYPTSGNKAIAALSKQSVISVAAHCSVGVHEPLCAVAYGAVPHGTEGRLVFVEGVTLLPPGGRWLALALRCIGKESNVVDSIIPFRGPRSGVGELDAKGGRGGKIVGQQQQHPGGGDIADFSVFNFPLNDNDRELCDEVADILSDDSLRRFTSRVGRCPEAILALGRLFRDWTKGSVDESPEKFDLGGGAEEDDVNAEIAATLKAINDLKRKAAKTEASAASKNPRQSDVPLAPKPKSEARKANHNLVATSGAALGLGSTTLTPANSTNDMSDAIVETCGYCMVTFRSRTEYKKHCSSKTSPCALFAKLQQQQAVPTPVPVKILTKASSTPAARGTPAAVSGKGSKGGPRSGPRHDPENHPDTPTELEKTMLCPRCHRMGHSDRTCKKQTVLTKAEKNAAAKAEMAKKMSMKKEIL